MLLFLSLVGFNTPSGSGQNSSNLSSGNPVPKNPINKALGDDDDDWSYAPPSNIQTPDDPPPPRPENPKEYERDESDPLSDSPGITGANKKKKKRKGKRSLRRGGFLSALKIDRGSSLGKGGKDNPYTLGGV